MALASNKSIKLAMAAVGLLLFGYGYYLQQHNSANKQNDTLAQEVIAHEVQEAKQSDQSEPSTPKLEQHTAQASEQVEHQKLDLPEYQALVRWQEERGYIAGEDYQTYQSYNDVTLKDLSNSGDVKAMLVLGANYTRERKPEESLAQFRKAATYGSTVALTHLATDAQAQAMRNDQDKTPEGRERLVTEVMALQKVVSLRGDTSGSISNINAFKETYKTLYKEDLKISPEQLKQIDVRAKAIYLELEQERHRLGLGEFDNSEPDVLKKSRSNS